MKILRGRGLQKHNFEKESVLLNWNFRRDWGGVQAKKSVVDGWSMDTFWNARTFLLWLYLFGLLKHASRGCLYHTCTINLFLSFVFV